MPPGDEVAFGVEAGLQLVISRGAVEVVADVVFAGPDDFDGSFGGAGNERGFAFDWHFLQRYEHLRR